MGGKNILMALRVIIGCETSQVITEQFIKMGCDAMSCDLKPGKKGLPHHQGDLIQFLRANRGRFDLGIFHPECRYLCFSGDRWIKTEPGRMDKRVAAFKFFMQCYDEETFDIPMVCVENSHSIYLNTQFRPPDQTVHPYHFGDPFKKSTCLWLRGLKPIVPTNILWQREDKCAKEPPSPNRSEIRAETYPGIARAFGEQWYNAIPIPTRGNINNNGHQTALSF